MDYFSRRNGSLCVNSLSCNDLASRFGTPLFVYSREALEAGWQQISQALGEHPHLICYSVKANSNLAVLDVLARLGSGFDIVSAGELQRVLKAGGVPEKVVFSGVGKSADELEYALDMGIHCFNVESRSELDRLAGIAAKRKLRAPVSLRINPDVDAGTHPYISTGLKENKFGISMTEARAVYARAASLDSINVQGMDCHIGSQLTSIEPYRDALARLVTLVDQLAEDGIRLSHLDVGGGLGICYENEEPLDIDAWASCIKHALGNRQLKLIAEPGRIVAGHAGVLLTRIEYIKNNEGKYFAVVDAAMNDLIRPSLYSAWQSIVEVNEQNLPKRQYDVVGPICESADFLGKNRTLAIAEGDLLAVMSAGAYGFVMSSNYNSRPRAAEVMVSASEAFIVRKRETISSLYANESVLP